MRNHAFISRALRWVPWAAVVLAGACTDSSSRPTSPGAPLEDDPIEVIYIPAPNSAARFASDHPGLPDSERLTQLRLQVFFDQTSQSLTYDVSGATADGRDTFQVPDGNGGAVEVVMPGWTVTPELDAALQAATTDLNHIDPNHPNDHGELDAATGEISDAIAANQVGGAADYLGDMSTDTRAYLGLDTEADDDGEGDDGSGGSGGGGLDGGLGGGGGGGTMPHVVEAVCAVNFAAVVAAHFAAMTATARAIVVQTKRVIKVCKSPDPVSFAACAIEMTRLAALGVVAGGLVVLLRMHVNFYGQVNEWTHEVVAAGVGQQANAEQANAAVVNARGAALKRMTIYQDGFAYVWGPVMVAAGLSLYKSVITTTGAALVLSATFIGCTGYVVNTFWQNSGVKIQIDQGKAKNANQGGGGGGPAPRVTQTADPVRFYQPGSALGGPGFPGLGDDASRNPQISPYLTSLPPALAVAQQQNVDLQAQVSPLNGGGAMNNLASAFSLQSQGEVWGLQLCTKLVPTVDTGGPYRWTNGSLMQTANTPYHLYSSGHGEIPWGNGIDLGATRIPTKYPTITQQRVCDGDDNNDGIPDAGQPNGIDDNNNGQTDEAGEVNSYCWDRDGDGLEDLYWVSLDSNMPNVSPGHTTNCGGISLDVIPKPQRNTIPGVDPRAAVQQMANREISQTHIIHVSSAYRVLSTGAKLGDSGMLRVKVTARTHLPTDPCVKYDQIYNPYYEQWGYVWDYSKPGCEYPGGGGPHI